MALEVVYRKKTRLDRKYKNDAKGKKSHVEQCFEDELPTIAVSEYMRSYSEQIRKWVNGEYLCLGTDGFGRSDTRENLRSFFEIDKNFIVFSALRVLKGNKIAIQYAKSKKINLNRENQWEI